MFKISIPKPCFEGWENMLPDERGRHCNACAKTVVDFSVMNDQAVQQYLIANYGSQICGRFNNNQIQRIQIDLPENIFRIQLPFWKKFFIAFLIIYGASFFSIDTTIAGIPSHTTIAFYEKSQANAPLKTERKNKKQKRKKYRFTKWESISTGNIILCDLPQDSMHTVGYTQTKELIVLPPEVPNFIYTDKNIILDTVPAMEKDNNSKIPQKEPKPKLPDSNTAFILPASLAIRKHSSKRKKA